MMGECRECRGCRWWTPPEEVIKWEPRPVTWGVCVAATAPESRAVPMRVLGQRAGLITAPDFGCTAFAPEEPA